MRAPREIATAYVRALVACDDEAARSLLAPGFRLRELSPPGFVDLDAEEGVAELVGFFRSFAEVELLELDAWEIGPKTVLRTRVRLLDPERGERQLEEHYMITVEEGLIAAVDALCSGTHPLP